MKKSGTIPCPTRKQTANGLLYLAFQFLLLPSLLTFVNSQMEAPLSSAELNFTFYLINFIAMLVIFFDFLGSNARQAIQHPVLFLQTVILGLVGYFACTQALTWAIETLLPTYANYNDQSIAAMSRSNFFLMTIGTVILVPPYEECIYRGLIFRNLYGKSRILAYAVSMLAFAAIHIVGYIGTYTPTELTLAILQYLPAGLLLAWSYAKANTLFAPITIHAIINFISIHRIG